MDVSFDFNSDSTYCSLYETIKRPIKKASKTIVLQNSKVLEKIHNEVLLHLQGTNLLGRIQVQQYMKLISQMKLKNKKDYWFAKKIQSVLFKIFKLTQKFERSVSLSGKSTMMDPIENCALTEDFNINRVDTHDPKTTLFQGNSISTNNSFLMGMLTNDNFISIDSQKCNSESISLQTNAAAELFGNRDKPKPINMKMDISGSDILNNVVSSSKPVFSEEIEVYLENYSETPSMSCMERNMDIKENYSRKICITNIDTVSTKVNETSEFFMKNNNTHNETEFILNNKLIISESFCDSGSVPSVKVHGNSESILKNNASDTNCSVDVFVNQNLHLTDSTNQEHLNDSTKIDVYDKNTTETIINNSENGSLTCDDNMTINSLVSKILEFNEYYFKNPNDELNSCTEDFNTFSYQVQKFDNFGEKFPENVTLKTISELGKMYEECYNNKIKKLCYDIGTDKTSWREVEKILNLEEDMKRNVNHTLNELFQKLSLREAEKNERAYKAKREKECLHDFDEIDRKKVNWRNLFLRNEAKLEAICEEFKTFLKLEKVSNTTEETEDSFEGLDWRKLLE